MAQMRRAQRGDKPLDAVQRRLAAQPPLVELLRRAREGVAGVRSDLIALQRRVTDPERAPR
jgi:hypothetical protein